MDQISTVMNVFLQIPSEVWYVILGAAGISIITQVVKNILSLENEKVVMTVFAGISFLASGLDYLMSAHNLPPTVLGVSTVTLMGIATPIYTYFVKPLNNFIDDVKAYKSQVAAKVNEVQTLEAATKLPDAKIVDQATDPKIVIAPTESVNTAPTGQEVVTPSTPDTADF